MTNLVHIASYKLNIHGEKVAPGYVASIANIGSNDNCHFLQGYKVASTRGVMGRTIGELRA